MLSAEQIQDIKDKLPRGYFKKTVEITGLSEKTVSNFFAGISYSESVHQAALDIAEAHQKRIKELNERTKELTSK